MATIVNTGRAAFTLPPLKASEHGGPVGPRTLKPGPNVVPDKLWERWTRHAGVVHACRSGRLGPGTPADKAVVPEPPRPSLADISVSRAKEVVDAERDVATLERWAAAEKRVTLQAIIAARIERLEGGRDDGE